MSTKIFVALLELIVGTAFIVVAFLRISTPLQKRFVFGYAGLCFYAFGALEYFGVVRLESLHQRMNPWDWIRVAGGAGFLWLAYRQHQRQPDRKAWLVGAIAGIGFLTLGIFHV